MNFTKLTDHLKLATDRLIGFKPEPYELHEGHGVATESIYKMVDQFHELFQHPRRVMPTPELLRLRASLIHEEAVVEGIPAAMNGDIEQLLDAMADFLYVGVGTMVAIKGGISTGMTYYTQEQSIDRFMQTIFVPGNTVFDDMAMPFQEAREASCMLEELADKLENKTVKDSELIQELRRVMNKIYVANCKYDSSDLGFRHADGTDKMIGFRISDGKILKSPTYSDVDLSSFVEQAKASAMYGMIKK